MILETERLRIREFTALDIDLIYDINNDPECVRFNSFDSMTPEQCRENLERWMGGYSAHPGTGAFCVESRDDSEKIGMAFIVETREPGQYEVGFRLRRCHWEKGYAKEITRGFIGYAQESLGAEVVMAEVYRDNMRSRGVFEKLGFTMHIHPEGDEWVVYRYSLI